MSTISANTLIILISFFVGFISFDIVSRTIDHIKERKYEKKQRERLRKRYSD